MSDEVKPGYHVSAPLSLHYQPPNGDELYTICVQLSSGASHVFTQSEPNHIDWLYARLRVRHAAYIMQGVYHVMSLHNLPSTAITAAARNLPNSHPGDASERYEGQSNQGGGSSHECKRTYLLRERYAF